MEFRWDQGRLAYFDFQYIKLIARALVVLDGRKTRGVEELRQVLEQGTGLPFDPKTYLIWRNYGRVFKIALLATDVNGRVEVTPLGRRMARGEIDLDDYIGYLARTFYLPTPALQGYEADVDRCYPICGTLRLLGSWLLNGDSPEISVDEFFQYIGGNMPQGDENIQYFQQLKPALYNETESEWRQVREMFITVSQASFLHWNGSHLRLDLPRGIEREVMQLYDYANPELGPRQADRSKEILRLAESAASQTVTFEPGSESEPEDLEFTEGMRVRRTHLKIERNRRLREAFFEQLPTPWKCDVCGMEPEALYPWVENLLQIHHVLPLSSPVRRDVSGTQLDELVPVCPSCHMAVHAYYRKWLRENEQDDFASKVQSLGAYEEAKQQVIRD